MPRRRPEDRVGQGEAGHEDTCPAAGRRRNLEAGPERLRPGFHVRQPPAFSALARICRVPPATATWEMTSAPTYENSIGELKLDERLARVTIYQTTAEGTHGAPLKAIHECEL